MVYLISGVLLGAAVIILTMPWSRRDPEDYSEVEFGYASRGPRGAVATALRELIDIDAVRRSRKGLVRKGSGLSAGTDPFVRAVYAGLVVPRGLNALRDVPGVAKKLPPMAARVRGAGLRVGPGRRAFGSLVALAAPAVAWVGVTRDVGDTGVGVVVGVIAVVAACGLLAMRGLTIAAARTMVAARELQKGSTSRSVKAMAGVVILLGGGTSDGGFGADLSDSGGDDSGGGSGGGGYSGDY